MLLKPEPLRAGDTLAIIATSTPINVSSEDTIERAFSRLRDYGFTIVETPNCRSRVGHAAGSIRDRADILNGLFADPAIDGILAYWGGFQSHQLLEYLNWETIRNNPKPLIGYSDTTALLVGIHTKTNLVTFCGPAGISFGKPAFPAYTWDHFVRTLISPQVPLSLTPAAEYSDNFWFLESDKVMRFEPNPGWKIFRHGKAEGPITGGNLGTMLLLAGTQWWPELEGRLLFVEEDESESPQTIDRMFTQLRHMGVYNRIAGLVIGRFSRQVKFIPTDTLEMILVDALVGYDFPVITGVDFGHTDPLITIPLGVRTLIDTSGPVIQFLEAGVA